MKKYDACLIQALSSRDRITSSLDKEKMHIQLWPGFTA
jgi:hypothetical protein